MDTLISQLGVDWRSLASQVVNFLILLTVLRFFLYKPLSRILKERRARVEEGLAKAEEAERRLKQIDEIRKDKLVAAEEEALNILRAAEKRSKEVEAQILAETRKKEAEELKRIESLLRGKEEEARLTIKKEAAEFVKRAIVKTVELSPDKIDEALIRKAVEEAAKSR
jgi:F-type H+-transporting ATPase subunit b